MGDLEAGLEAMVAAAIPHPITWQQLRDAVAKDKVMTMLSEQISSGFPPDKKLLRLELREFFQHRDVLTQVDGVPLYKDRVIIPAALRAAVLETLHSAHQGITGMTERAQQSVWWPGITPQIKEMRDKCKNCTEHAPSQPSAPPLPLPQPDYPFQFLVSDYFQEGGNHYLVLADRFSGWPTVQFCGGSTSSAVKLVENLRAYFSMHGIPEEIATDGGSTYMAYETQKFLSDYGINHRVSSVAFPHSNQRAELAVKSLKRLCRENTNRDGSLDSDKFLRAVMTYRNTPDRDTGRSPAQVIFGRQLKDFLPAPLMRYKPQPQWILLKDDREKALRKRALKNMEKLEIGTRKMDKLEVHDTVQVQNQIGNHPSRWDITGSIVEVRPFDQYIVKVHGSGRLTTRNKKFLRKIARYAQVKTPQFQYTAPVPTLRQEVGPVPDVPRQDSPVESNPVQIKDVPVPSDPVSEEVVEPPAPEFEARQSTRIRKTPEKLEVSWKGQSYEKQSAVLVQPLDCSTTWHSLAYSDHLHPARPGGGGRASMMVVMSTICC